MTSPSSEPNNNNREQIKQYLETYPKIRGAMVALLKLLSDEELSAIIDKLPPGPHRQTDLKGALRCDGWMLRNSS